MYAKQRGFTLIELMLAMAFLSILLIAVAVITIQVGRLYDKGQTLKAVNQAGRDLSDSLRRDAQSVGSIPNTYVAPSQASGELGRLCLGTVSYVWNTAENLRSNKGATYQGNNEQIIMARVADVGGNYCRADAVGGYPKDVPADRATEMLKSTDRDLAAYSVGINPLVTSGASKLYVIKFTLGTNEEGTINTADMSCKPPTDTASNFDFCAVNQFQLLVSVG